MTIPKPVLQEAKNLIDQNGNYLKYKGCYKDYLVYQYIFPDNEFCGFPIIYLYSQENNCVETKGGHDALDILALFND